MLQKQSFGIHIDDKHHAVIVKNLGLAGEVIPVEVDGKKHEVTITGDGRFLVRAEGDTHHVLIGLDDPRHPSQAGVAGKSVPLQLFTAQEEALNAALSAGQNQRSGGRVDAPISGRVVTLLASEGQRVEANVPVLIVEAMKMENELLAPLSGVVKAIAVKAGDTIDTGQFLFEIEADEDDSDEA